jgi:hypothetical protein
LNRDAVVGKEQGVSHSVRSGRWCARWR